MIGVKRKQRSSSEGTVQSSDQIAQSAPRNDRAWWGPLLGVGFLLLLFIAPEFVVFPFAYAVHMASGGAGTYDAFTGWITTTAGNTWYVALTDLVILAIVGLIVYKKRSTLNGLGLGKGAWRQLGLATVFFLAYILVYLLVISVVSALVPGFDVEQERDIGFNDLRGVVQMSVVFVLLVVITPIVEEIMFRGFLFRGFRKKMPFWLATALTSLVFGAVHLTSLGDSAPVWVAALDTGLLSVALCVAREYSKSLWPAIYMHGAKNALAFVFLYLVH